jgi:hypothetical protein
MAHFVRMSVLFTVKKMRYSVEDSHLLMAALNPISASHSTLLGRMVTPVNPSALFPVIEE